MTTVTVRDTTDIPPIDHAEAMAITVVENARFGELLALMAPEDWARSTDCALWDVHGLVAHVVGSAAGQASLREFIRQVRRGRPLLEEIGGGYWWDGMNQLQVVERDGRTPVEMVDEWDAASAAGVRARSRLPRPVARLPLLHLPAPVGRQPVAYLFDMGFTRDVWMHRVDVARATDRPIDLDPGHDGRIVADIVAEWARTHGEPFTLSLEGPAGGVFRSGSGGDHVELDAIEFCRTLSGRASGTGLLRHPLPL